MDTNATSRQIRDNLSTLDSYMRYIKSDVPAFNMHVRSLLDSLRACGETSNNLLNNLFRGYKAASDSTFVQYIQRKEEQYDDGDSFTSEKFMHQARNKYIGLAKFCKHSSHTWHSPYATTPSISTRLQGKINQKKRGP